MMVWLRSAAFAVWFYGVTLAFCLASPPTRLRARWLGGAAGQRVALRYSQRWARTVLAGLQPICDIPWSVTGRENLPAGPAVIAAQHQSTFETLLWVMLLPNMVFVLKQELIRIPLFGGLLSASGMIAVDRNAGASAIRILLREGEAAIAAGKQIVIFPEGTRMIPGIPGTLHPGVAALASKLNVPVVPAVTDSGLAWRRYAFRKVARPIRIQILPPLPPGLPRRELMQRLSDAYAAGPQG
jgi:1-acyl-sn-glycerol-3-phosphate acyltransferase